MFIRPLAAGTIKRVTLELGGKSPVIVMPDADIAAASKAIAGEIAFKTGQYCAAGTRVFVHASIHDQLVTTVAEVLQQGARRKTSHERLELIEGVLNAKSSHGHV